MEVLEVPPGTIGEEESTSSKQLSILQLNESSDLKIFESLSVTETTEISESESHIISKLISNDEPLLNSKDIQILYSRAQKGIFVQNSELIPEIEDDDQSSRLKAAGRPPLTKVHEFKVFMEVSTSLKTCLIQLINNIKTSTGILNRNISILRDPGFGSINILRCWIWIFEESIILTKPTEKESSAWKIQVTNLMQDIVSAHQNFHTMTEKLEACYQKLQLIFAQFVKKTRSKFHRNVTGAQELWNTTEKFNLEQDLNLEPIEWLRPTELQSGRKILKVRWTLDGITLRMDGKSPWLKFQSVKAFQDKQNLVKLFTAGLKDPWNKTNGTLVETEKLMLSPNHTSVQTLLQKLFSILQLDTKYIFVPKEEVVMLNATLTNLALFQAIQPLLDQLKKRVATNLELVLELSGRQRDIIQGKGKRVPLGRWSELMLELEVHSTVETVFFRNSKKNSDNQVIDETGIVTHEDSAQLIYLSNQDSDDRSIKNQDAGESAPSKSFVKANPTVESIFDTCFIFLDIRPEYETAWGSILKNRKFKDHLGLCNDNVKEVYTVVNVIESAIKTGNHLLTNAIEYLLRNDCDPNLAMSTSTWINIMCRSLNVWDISDLSPRSKAYFQDCVTELVTKTEDLETSLSNLMAFMIKQKKHMERLYEHLKGISGFDIISRIKFKQEIQNDTMEAFPDTGLVQYDETVTLNFTNSNMEVSIFSKSDMITKKNLSLNGATENIKVKMMCNPLNHLMRIMNKAILNIAWSTKTLEANVDITSIGESLIPSNAVFVPHFHKLETAVIVGIVEELEMKISRLIRNLQKLDDSVGQLSGMVHIIRLQIEDKKLAEVGRIDPLDRESIQAFENIINQMPDSIQILDIVARGEYRRLVEHGIRDLKMLSAVEKVSEETSMSEPIEKAKLPLYKKLTSELLNSEVLRDAYLQTLVYWLKQFSRQMSENMANTLSALIAPKVSQAIADPCKLTNVGKLDKSLGYFEGLSFLLRESIENLKPQQDLNSAKDDPIATIKGKLFQFADTIRKLEAVSKCIGPVLKKLTFAIVSYKHKLPHDMSFLDDQVEELTSQPDIFNIVLAIWRSSNDLSKTLNRETLEMELHWTSSNKYAILSRTSTQRDSWVEFSMMSSSSQVKTINSIAESCINAFSQACDHFIKVEADVKNAKNLLKHVCNKLHDDEKSSLITPSTVYVILKQFEYHISLATLIYEAITNLTTNAKAVLAAGMSHLKSLTSKDKGLSKRIRKYPKSLIIKVIIKAPVDTDQWLRVDGFIDENAIGDHDSSLIEIKAAVKVQSSRSVNILSSEKGEPQQSQSRSRKLFDKTSLTLLAKKSTPKDDLLTSLQKSEIAISSILRETYAILRSPNTSLDESVKADHFIGILILLLNFTLELQFFKEASDIQRTQVLNHCRGLINRFKNLGSASIVDEMHLNLTKIQKSADSLEKALVHKFNQGDDGSKEYHRDLFQDLEIPPDELAENIAVKMSGYVWNAVCSVDTGVVLKSHKSHESHGYMRLPLSKRIEIITSVMQYIDQILIIAESNLVAVSKDLISNKGIIKNHVKKAPRFLKKGLIDSSNITDTFEAVRCLKSACDASHNYIDKMLEIIDDGGGIVKNIFAYLNLKFRLETPNPDGSNRIIRDYRTALENKILELEISLAELQRYPISVDVPLSLSPIDFEFD